MWVFGVWVGVWCECVSVCAGVWCLVDGDCRMVKHLFVTSFYYQSSSSSSSVIRMNTCAVIVAALIACLSAVQSADDVVYVWDGLLKGVVLDKSRYFRGIPYAAPPIKDLRWRAPQPVTPWQGKEEAVMVVVWWWEDICVYVHTHTSHISHNTSHTHTHTHITHTHTSHTYTSHTHTHTHANHR